MIKMYILFKGTHSEVDAPELLFLFTEMPLSVLAREAFYFVRTLSGASDK